MRIVKDNSDTNLSSLKIVDDEGNILVKFSGPMSYCAAGAFIKYHDEKGLVRFALDRCKEA